MSQKSSRLGLEKSLGFGLISQEIKFKDDLHQIMASALHLFDYMHWVLRSVINS